MNRARWVAVASALTVLVGSAFTGVSLKEGRQNLARGEGGDADRAAETGSKPKKVAVKSVDFVGTPAGKPVPLPARAGAPAPDPARAARIHLRTYGFRFGIRDPQRQLQTAKTVKAELDQKIVRFQQVQNGLPVVGGEVAVSLDRQGGMLSVNGATTRTEPPARRAGVTAARARTIAVADTARRQKLPASSLVASDPRTWLYDPALLGAPGLPVTRKVWRVEVTPRTGSGLRQLVLVDITDGRVVLSFNQVARAVAETVSGPVAGTVAKAGVQVVCDAGNRRGDTGAQGRHANECDGSGLPYVYKPGDPEPRPGGDAGQAGVNINAASDFYRSKLGVDLTDLLGYDAGDGQGKALRSTVRHCVTVTVASTCPSANAYWDSGIRGGQWRGQMFFGSGSAAADDVVAHELTHGVTEKNANLLYYSQAGAINESMSDVFGELADLSNGVGDDSRGRRWQLGEDLPTGPVRDFSHPPTHQQPDRMTSPLWKSGGDDNGGIHRNSGVGNKAAFLITEGGTFNGRAVTGVGIGKAARIYYRVEQLLTSGADYAQLYRVLPQACTDLVGTRVPGGGTIGPADCTAVQDAVDATEMNKLAVVETTPAAAAVCPRGTAKGTNLAFDDFEPDTSPHGFTWNGSVPAWREVKDYTLPVQNEQSGYQLFGQDPVSAGDHTKAMATGIRVPAGAATYVRFVHAYGFDWQDAPESASRAFFDGGFVEQSVDGGAWRPARFAGNGPGRAIRAAGGRVGFGGDSLGWLSSRINLSAHAGHTVRLRFRIVSDRHPAASAGFGWFVDNFRVYACGTALPDTPKSVSARGGTGRATVGWSAPDWTGSGPLTGYQVRAYPNGPSITLPARATTAVLTGLEATTSYSFGVRALSASGRSPEVRTGVLAGTTLSLAAAPAGVSYGDRVTFSGRLWRTGTTTGVPGAAVKVVGRVKGQTAWKFLANARTGANGEWSVEVVPTGDSDYMAKFSSGSAAYMGTSTAPRSVPVSFSVSAVPSGSEPREGAFVNVTGAVRPFRDGKAVLLQRSTAQGWVTIATTSLARDGSYLFRRTYTQGIWTLRTFVEADPHNATGTSRAFTLRVT